MVLAANLIYVYIYIHTYIHTYIYRCSASVNVQNNECFKCGEPKPASTLAAEKEEEPDGVSPYGKHLLYQVRQLQDGISKG